MRNFVRENAKIVDVTAGRSWSYRWPLKG